MLNVVLAEIEKRGWRQVSGYPGKSGQATVLFVEHPDGRTGALRVLKSPTKKAQRRFEREFEIVSKHDHPSIMRLLDYDLDANWYISQRGNDFRQWWTGRRRAIDMVPDDLAADAFGVIGALADGLAGLHPEGVVHRDIKPKNVVVVGPKESERPVLIDFGIAYRPSPTRLTSDFELLGNMAASPDLAMNREENVSPWIDVFQLAQLLIWMLRRRLGGWSRPLHWRWVDYIVGIGPDTDLALRAVTALASEPRLSPRNGAELAQLLSDMAPIVRKASVVVPESTAAVDRGRARGRAQSALEAAEHTSLMEAAYPQAAQFIALMAGQLEEIAMSFERVGLPVRISDRFEFSAMHEAVLRDHSGSGQRDIVHVTCGGDAEIDRFSIRLHCVAHSPVWNERRAEIRNTNPYEFWFLCSGGVLRPDREFPVVPIHLFLAPDGKILNQDHRSLDLKETTVDEVLAAITGWFSSEQLWFAVSG
ncbi:MAG: serine/threonine protein kinase [Chloroflexi bacterium]|nr:serine/threonine protein kinase [Chloroflexota bacterium]